MFESSTLNISKCAIGILSSELKNTNGLTMMIGNIYVVYLDKENQPCKESF